MGIGVFVKHENKVYGYYEKLAEQQKLYLIIALNDYIMEQIISSVMVI